MTLSNLKGITEHKNCLDAATSKRVVVIGGKCVLSGPVGTPAAAFLVYKPTGKEAEDEVC